MKTIQQPCPEERSTRAEVQEGPTTTGCNVIQAPAEGWPGTDQRGRFPSAGETTGTSPSLSRGQRAFQRRCNLSPASKVTRRRHKAFDERTSSGFEGQVSFFNSAAQEREREGAGPGAAVRLRLRLGNLRPRLAIPPPTPASASSPGPIRKQPSGSGNSREDPEAVSAVTRQCGNPPFALRRWRQLRRRPRARMAGGDSRGPVREGASMHARGDEARGGAELRAGGWGGAEGSLEKGAGPRRQERGGGGVA